MTSESHVFLSQNELTEERGFTHWHTHTHARTHAHTHAHNGPVAFLLLSVSLYENARDVRQGNKKEEDRLGLFHLTTFRDTERRDNGMVTDLRRRWEANRWFRLGTSLGRKQVVDGEKLNCIRCLGARAEISKKREKQTNTAAWISTKVLARMRSARQQKCWVHSTRDRE